jgi:hypothetical protein
MKVASDRPMVLSSRLGGVKDALLLIANPLKPDWCCACYRRSFLCGSEPARDGGLTFNIFVD